MPALAIADTTQNIDATLPPLHTSTQNPYPRPSPHPVHLETAHNHAHFDASNAAHFISPTYERIYPQLTHPIPPHFTNIPPSSAMFNYHTLPPHASTPWQAHVPFLHHNPYPPPQPPQLVHKVWILDCRSCGTFLTNRGMKAVLLLRPNVSLYSTDALPINCSAFSSNPDALRPPPCRATTSTSIPRTCECLTQTLCCHTCGNPVGYMIVTPCARCTSSISATNRATNGHRFVFHSSEIVASVRHHIPNEPGVMPVEFPTPPPSSPPPLAPAYPTVFHSSADVPTHRRAGSFVPSQSFQPSQPSSPSQNSEYLHSVESTEFVPSSGHSSPDSFASVSPASPQRSPRPLLQSPFPRPAPISEIGGSMPEAVPRKLKAGDILYWHHLTKNGEIPGVEEDPRARVPIRGDRFKYLDR